jgi:hypothetical protein
MNISHCKGTVRIIVWYLVCYKFISATKENTINFIQHSLSKHSDTLTHSRFIEALVAESQHKHFLVLYSVCFSSCSGTS